MYSTKNLVLSVISAVVWYAFIYYALVAIKTSVDLYTASLILLVLAGIGIVVCPLVQSSDEWKAFMKKRK